MAAAAKYWPVGVVGGGGAGGRVDGQGERVLLGEGPLPLFVTHSQCPQRLWKEHTCR